MKTDSFVHGVGHHGTNDRRGPASKYAEHEQQTNDRRDSTAQGQQDSQRRHNDLGNNQYIRGAKSIREPSEDQPPRHIARKKDHIEIQEIGRAHVLTPVTPISTLFPSTTLFRSPWK